MDTTDAHWAAVEAQWPLRRWLHLGDQTQLDALFGPGTRRPLQLGTAEGVLTAVPSPVTLSDDEWADALDRYRRGECSQRALAAALGTSHGQVQRALRRQGVR